MSKNKKKNNSPFPKNNNSNNQKKTLSTSKNEQSSSVATIEKQIKIELKEPDLAEIEAFKESQKNAFLIELETQRNEIILEAQSNANKLIEDARTLANQLIEEKNKEIDELVLAKKEAISKLEVEINNKVKETNIEHEKIIKQQEKLTSDILSLHKEKEDYKIKINVGFKEDFERIIKELDDIKNANSANLNEIKDLQRKLKSCETENTDYLSYIQQYSAKNNTQYLNLKIEELNNTIVNIQEDKAKLYQQIRDLESKIELYGDDPQRAIEDNRKLTKIIDEMKMQFHGISLSEIQTLQNIKQEVDKTHKEYEKIKLENTNLEIRLNELKVKVRDTESYARFIKVLELQNNELRNELDRNIEKYNSKVEEVFSSLSSLDKSFQMDVFENRPNISLKQLCDKFRGYMQNTEKYYYSIEQIRTFIAGFASSRLMILEGLSGTGKSSLPRLFQNFIGAKTITVPVQSSWKDRNDLLGFYNDFKKQYKETDFLKALYESSINPQRIYCIVLDEVNLSRIEYYFADFISVLEKNPDEWWVELISEKIQGTMPNAIHDGKIRVGENVWFIGTANKDDSTFLITDKVYDRSVVLGFSIKNESDKNIPKNDNSRVPIGFDQFAKLIQESLTNFSQSDLDKQSKIIQNLDLEAMSRFDITFGNRIENQLKNFVPVYVACGGTIHEAIDMMFSKKVIRKLEYYYEESKDKKIAEFSQWIIDNYPKEFPVTLQTLSNLQKR